MLHVILRSLAVFVTLAAFSAGAQTVGLYERFEGVIESPKSYADPFRDVTLEVEYTKPDGVTFRFWGFHDGGGTWRFRTLADQAGEWKYTARFSDGSAQTSGSFRVTQSAKVPGIIGIHRSNPVWFGYSNGKPALIRGFHIGDRYFAANWPESQRRQFLDWIQQNGYNFLSIASHFLNRDEAGRGRGWDTPRLWPLNAAEYTKMEALLDQLAERRILVWGFAGFFGKSSNYPRDPADQELYIRYTLARLAPYWNVLWNVAGPEPNLRGDERWMSDEEVSRLGRRIGALDPWKHPLSVHNRTGDDPFRDSDWTTYGVLQGPKTADPAKLSRGLLESHHPAKPLLAQETLWSRNTFHTRSLGRDYTDDEIRQNAWVIQMSAASLVFADNDGNSSTGFTGTLNPSDAHPTRHGILRRIWDFLETLPYGEMRPAQQLVDQGFCLAGAGKLLVYLPNGGAVTLQGEWSSEGSSRERTWVSGSDPTRRVPASPTGASTFQAPTAEDWLLLLSR